MSNQKVLGLRISEIEEIIESLQLEQRILGDRVEALKVEIKEVARDCEALKATERQTVAPQEIKLPLEEYRKHIGKKVRILNPKHGDCNYGTVTKVGKLYVLVKLPSGQERKRIASNIRLIKDVDTTRS